MDGTSKELTFRQRLRLFSPRLAFVAVYLSLAALNFGYDVGTFQGVQAMTAFRRRFGEYNETTEKWILPSYLTAVMNSTPFLGKLIGVMACGPIAERWGRKMAVLIMAVVSLIGCTLQTSAHSAAQFTAGRIINFATTGFTIVVTPIYQSECVPAPLRGMITAMIQFQISFGSLIASLVNLGTAGIDTDTAWLVPIGLQLLLPIIIALLLYWMPESPRWLLSRGRHDEARRSLQILRKKGTEDAVIDQEIRALESANANKDKGSWKELFDDRNRRRTTIAILAMFFQQVTGQAFVSQYSVVFFQEQNIPRPFLLSVVSSVVGICTITFTGLTVDTFGRRRLLMIGAAAMFVFIFTLGGTGLVDSPNTHVKGLMVACIILFTAAYLLSWAPVSYVVLGEASSSRLKEKTNNLAGSISVITTFVVSFTVPYLIREEDAGLGPKVGFIYGSICAISFVVVFFLIPEMKGRSLEEIDEMFNANVPTRKFRKYRSTAATDVDLIEATGKTSVDVDSKEPTAIQTETVDRRA